MGILSLIATIAPIAFEVAEKLFPPKTGETKRIAVLNTVKAFLDPLTRSGAVQSAVPDDATLIAEIQKLFDQSPYAKNTAEVVLGGKTYTVTLTVKG